jgi:hypothetical protein
MTGHFRLSAGSRCVLAAYISKEPTKTEKKTENLENPPKLDPAASKSADNIDFCTYIKPRETETQSPLCNLSHEEQERQIRAKTRAHRN